MGLVSQFRYAYERELTEVVKGFGRLNERPADAAARELAEELGIGARHWDELGEVPAMPGVSKIPHHCFLARDLFKIDDPTQNLDEPPELLNTTWVELGEFLGGAASGKITDGISLAIVMIILARKLYPVPGGCDALI